MERHPELKNIDSAFILTEDENGEERIAWKSNMLVRLAEYIPWPLKPMLVPFKILPLAIGDWLYDLVAKNRNKLFRRYESCPVPPPGFRERFLIEL